MKSLSLQMTHNTTLKKADGMSKSSMVPEKSGEVESNKSFQMMLSRQVKNQKDSAQNNSVLLKVAQKNSHRTSAEKNNADLKVAGEEKELKAEHVELAVKSKEQEGIDLKPMEILNNPADTSATGLIVPFAQIALTPLASPAYLEKMQETSSELDARNIFLGSIARDTTMAPSLSNQAKEQHASDIEAPLNDSQALLSKSISEQMHWQDADQQGAGKLGAESESTSNKLMINATKESGVNKELMQPAVFQAMAQINSTLPMQQLAPSSNIIQASPGKSGWDQAISQKIVWMVGAAEQSATLTLNPPDLGPLQVVIRVNNDMVDTAFMSDNVEVRQALQDGIANLREKLSESGIQLGQASVSSGGQPKQEFQQTTQNRLASQLNGNVPVLEEEKIVMTNTRVNQINGLVDTFA